MNDVVNLLCEADDEYWWHGTAGIAGIRSSERRKQREPLPGQITSAVRCYALSNLRASAYLKAEKHETREPQVWLPEAAEDGSLVLRTKARTHPALHSFLLAASACAAISVKFALVRRSATSARQPKIFSSIDSIPCHSAIRNRLDRVPEGCSPAQVAVSILSVSTVSLSQQLRSSSCNAPDCESAQGLPFCVAGVGDLLSLFRCISCRYCFSLDSSRPTTLGAPGRVFLSAEVRSFGTTSVSYQIGARVVRLPRP